MSPDGMLDSIVQLYSSSAGAVFQQILPVAAALFLALATIQFSWDLGMWVLHDEDHLVGKATRQLFVIAFFYAILVGLPLWLPPLLGGFEELGRRVTGLDGLSPSAIFDQGISLALTLFDTWSEIALLLVPVTGMFRGLAFWVVLLAFALIAWELARVLVEGSLVLGGLVIFLAGAGHRATFGLAEGYLRYALSVGTRAYVLYLLVGVGRNLGSEWDALLRDQSFFGAIDPRLHFVVLAGCVLFAMLVRTLPATIAQTVVGSFALGGINPLADRK